MEIVLMIFQSRFSGCFGDRFPGFLGLENRFENRWIFGDVTDPETLNWGGESGPDLSS